MGNYRSALTVRPHTAPELPGTEFCLTGFEDPGVQLPETIITWVSIYAVGREGFNKLSHCTSPLGGGYPPFLGNGLFPHSVMKFPLFFWENFVSGAWRPWGYPLGRNFP